MPDTEHPKHQKWSKTYFWLFRPIISISNHAESDQQSKILQKRMKTEKNQIFSQKICLFASKTPKMAKTPIFDHLESRYQFLTMRKVISGQKYYRNTQNLKKFDFFAKKFFSSICPHWQKCPNLKIRFLKNGLSNVADIWHANRPYIELIAYRVSFALA